MPESVVSEPRRSATVPTEIVQALFDTLDGGVLISERAGRIVMGNVHARSLLELGPSANIGTVNLFSDLLHVDPKVIFGQIEGGEREVDLQVVSASGAMRARIQWLPEPDWLVVQLQAASQENNDAVEQHTVQGLLQEREITYRNLLAAYLRLQEVNRQKTVFLASAAHELKTPLAVIKGYYDLLLSGSLGKLNDKQRDILQESKDSCERLVRLVSMFLNYSALESGKLVLHLRENDLRDCLTELATRWHEAFQRKHVRLEVIIDRRLPIFKFDYQKVQQTVANLLDNALKHTPAGRLRHAARRTAFLGAPQRRGTSDQDRRRARSRTPNSVRVSVTDTGRGHRGRASSGDFRGFRARGPNFFGYGLGPGHCQAAGAGAPRQNLGG